MSTEFIQSSVMLTKAQKEYIKSNFINLSRLTRASVDSLIENRKGQVLHAGPSKIPNEDFSNVT